MKKLTVGRLCKLLAKLPDDAPIFPTWNDGPPGDHEPGVEMFGFTSAKDADGTPGLAIKVGLFYLNN
jgi:hypothetical protein